MADLTTKAGDSPKLRAVLSYEDGQLANLTGATVRVSARKPNGALVLNAAACDIVGDPLAGLVAFARPAETGPMRFEWRVTWADNTERTFPDDGYLSAELLPRLA